MMFLPRKHNFCYQYDWFSANEKNEKKKKSHNIYKHMSYELRSVKPFCLSCLQAAEKLNGPY